MDSSKLRRIVRSVEAKSLDRAGTTKAANASSFSVFPICNSAPNATAGAPPYSKALANIGNTCADACHPQQLDLQESTRWNLPFEVMSLTLRCATGRGKPGMTEGSRLKKRSFSLESLTASDSMKEMVSTSVVFSAADSASRAGLSLRVGCEASKR